MIHTFVLSLEKSLITIYPHLSSVRAFSADAETSIVQFCYADGQMCKRLPLTRTES
jgi:hypothetical protein